MAKVTPSRQQYLDFKAQFPDAIVMFRLGDFYEMFDDDAHTAARELDLVLTSRPVSKGERVPMCGVPHHAVEGYIAKLVERGYHVAVIEQVGSAPVNGLTPREVSRVITPGTVMEPAMLADTEEATLAVVEELARLEPREVLLPSTWAERGVTLPPGAHVTPLADYRFEHGYTRQLLLAHFEVSTLAGFGLQDPVVCGGDTTRLAGATEHAPEL